MTAYPIQPSFARGELSPKLHARVDIEHYRTGLAQCRNFCVMRQGGLRRRPGTHYMGPTKHADLLTVIRPFVFSPSQSYALELGDHYMRLFAAAGQVIVGGAPYEVATPWAAADLRDLKFAASKDVLYVTHPAYAPHRISRKAETDWTIEPVEFSDGPYLQIVKDGSTLRPSDTGNAVPKMTSNTAPSGVASASSSGDDYPAWQAFDRNDGTDWRAGGVDEAWLRYEFPSPIRITGYFIQASRKVESFSIGDVDYKIPGALRAPRAWTIEGSDDGSGWVVLHSKSAVTGWGDGERRYYEFLNDEAYKFYRLVVSDVDDSQTTPRPVSIASWALSAGGPDAPTITLTASKPDSINDGAGFLASDVGRHIRMLDQDAVWHWFKITAWNSALQVEAKLRSAPLPSTSRVTTFRLGAFAESSGWPASVCFYQERLFYGRTDAEPQTVWSSKRGDFEDFGVSTPLQDDDAISFTIPDAGEIRWMVDGGDLLLGTTTAVRSLGSADKSKGFSATNFQQGRPAQGGAATPQPALAADVALFIGRYGTAIREASYSFDSAGYVSPDLSVLSEHLLKPGVVEMAYALDPNATLWAAVADGTLVTVTYEKEQKMVAFTGQQLGGGGKVWSLCVTPGDDRDDVWFVSRRAGKQSVLRLGEDFDGGDAREAFYVDEGLSYSGAPATRISGLDHLIGVDVAALADAEIVERMTVEPDGSITLPNASRIVHVGLPFRSLAETLPLPGARDGSGLGRKKRVKKVMVNLLETGRLVVKASGRSEDATLRSVVDVMDEAPPLTTGSQAVTVDDSWQHGGVVQMIVSDPVPACILAVTPVYEGEP